MAYFDKETVGRWTALVRAYLDDKEITRHEVTQGWSAWAIAGKAGILREAYNDRRVTDAHIQTALEKIFPECEFRDAKRH